MEKETEEWKIIDTYTKYSVSTCFYYDLQILTFIFVN